MAKRQYLFFCILVAGLLPINLFAQSDTTVKKLTNGVAMEKGIKFALLTFSLTDRRAENDDEFLTHYVDQTRSDWSVSTDLGFMLDRNFGMGLGFSYGQTNEESTTESSFGV